MVKIVTDSLSEVPSDIAQALRIAVVPLYVHFGNESYRDGVDMSSKEFYQRLVNGPAFPTTSAPSPGEFARVYDELADETNEILSIHASSKLSGTFDAALQGREQRANGKCRVNVVDTMNIAMAQGLVVIAAAEEAAAGGTLDHINDVVAKALPKASFLSCFDTLEYLRKGGRIGRATALLGSILKMNPLITVKDGEIHPAGRERSRSRAIERLYRFAEGFRGKIRKLAVEYVAQGSPDGEAETLARRLAPLLPPGEEIYMSSISPVIGTHSGPGAIGVSLLEE